MLKDKDKPIVFDVKAFGFDKFLDEFVFRNLETSTLDRGLLALYDWDITPSLDRSALL